MGRRCVLHLGMNKAGSTAIQAAFRDYADSKMLYPRVPNETHTRMLCLPFLENPSPLLFRQQDHSVDRNVARQALQNLLETEQRSFVFSSEFLSGFPDQQSCQRLKQFLDRYFSDYRLVAYIREPFGYIKSVIQQDLKIRYPGADFRKHVPQYKRRFEVWEKTFVREAIDYVLFHPKQFYAQDIVMDFAKRAGLSEVFARRRSGLANTSLSAEATTVLCAYRERFRTIPQDVKLKRAEAHMVFALKQFGNSKFDFDPERLAPAIAGFQAEIRWIESRLGEDFSVPEKTPEYRFSSLEELAQAGHQLDGALRQWMQTAHPHVATEKRNVVGMLESLRQTFLE